MYAFVWENIIDKRFYLKTQTSKYFFTTLYYSNAKKDCK